MAEFNNLRGRIVSKYGNIGAFADKLRAENVDGSSFATVSKKLNGKSEFTREDITVWCKYLDIDQEDVGRYFFAQMVQ